MKKYLALAMCLLMLCVLLTAPVHAEEVEPDAAPSITETEQTPLPEDTLPPSTNDNVAGDESTTTDSIVSYLEENLEEIAVIATLIVTTFYYARKIILVIKSIATVNHNTITVAKDSETSVKDAREAVQEVSATVSGYVDAMNALLAEVRSNDDEKQKLVAKLDEATRFINTAKLATVELANEMAELLVLANIPTSKKDELYSRHRAAVAAIAAAERTEVTRHDGAEA